MLYKIQRQPFRRRKDTFRIHEGSTFVSVRWGQKNAAPRQRASIPQAGITKAGVAQTGITQAEIREIGIMQVEIREEKIMKGGIGKVGRKVGQFLIIGLVLMLLAGCGRKENGSGSASNDVSGSDSENAVSSEANRELTWEADMLPLGETYEQAALSDRIYGLYRRDGQVLVDRLEKTDLSVSASYDLGDAALVSGMAADQSGMLYVLGQREESLGMWRIAADGTFQDFTGMELEDAGDGSDIFLKGVYRGTDGSLYVWCNLFLPEIIEEGGREETVYCDTDRVYITDSRLQPVFHVDISNTRGGQTLSFRLDQEGKPVFLAGDGNGVYAQGIDTAGKSLGEQERLGTPEELFGTESVYVLENVTPTESGFLYCQGNRLYEFDQNACETKEVLNLSSYGVLSSEILAISKSGEAIELIDDHGGQGKQELVSLALGTTEKAVVTLGLIGMAQDLEHAVAEFNRSNSEYRVEIVDYAQQGEDYEDGLEKLKLDIVRGEAPDVIDVSGIDYEMFCRKGALADLYELMEQDTELTGDMLVPSVAGAYEEEGHLYVMAPGFQLHTMWGYADVTRKESGVTFEELFRLLEESGKNLNAIGGFSADEPILTRLSTVSMDEFVDWENGTCDFTGDYFKKVLSFAKEYTGNYTGGTYSERIRKREIVLSAGIIASVADYQIQQELYGGEAAFIGYPTAEGNGMALAFRGSAVAVNGKAENKNGAWEFVKYFLLQGYDGQGFPVVQRQLEQVLQDAMKEETVESEDGGSEKLPKASYSNGYEQILVYAASQKDVDTVVGLIESTANRFESHAEIQNIIDEEAEGYFSGQTDLDRTAEKIQNRVQLYLDEQIG